MFFACFLAEIEGIELIEELAEGGEGVVHRAKWLCTPVAAKVIRGSLNPSIMKECSVLR